MPRSGSPCSIIILSTLTLQIGFYKLKLEDDLESPYKVASMLAVATFSI
jgi:hypothetical protein